MESEQILNDLLSSDKDTVTKAMDALKELLDKNKGVLMIGNIKKLYRGFYNILASHSFDAVHQCTNLLIDLLKNDDPDTEIHFSKIIPLLVQNLGSTKIPICTATFNCLKAYGSKIGGLGALQLKPAIVLNNFYLGIEGTKNNLENIRQYLHKLQGDDVDKNGTYDQLEQELMKQASGVGMLQLYFLTFHLLILGNSIISTRLQFLELPFVVQINSLQPKP